MKTSVHPVRSTRATKGFTLVEIMAVVLIIGLVLSGAVVAIGKGIQQGKVSNAKGTVASLEAGITSMISQAGQGGAIPLTENFTGNPIPATEFSGTGTTAANVGAAATLDGLLLGGNWIKQAISVKMGNGAQAPLNNSGVYVTWVPGSQQFTATAAPTINYGTCQSPASTDVTRGECAPVDPAATPGVPTANGVNFMLDGHTSLGAGSRVAYLLIKGASATDAYNLAVDVDGTAYVAGPNLAQTQGAVAFAAPVGGQTDIYYYVTSQ